MIFLDIYIHIVKRILVGWFFSQVGLRQKMIVYIVKKIFFGYIQLESFALDIMSINMILILLIISSTYFCGTHPTEKILFQHDEKAHR